MTEQTMSSREIANLTCKRHDNVMRDIKSMFDELNKDFGGKLSIKDSKLTGVPKLSDIRDGIRVPGFGVILDRGVLKTEDTPVQPAPYIDLQNGQTYYEYHLNREMTDLLLTGYSVHLRLNVIRRWRELEAAVAPKLPVNYLDALKALVASEEKKAELHAQLVIAAPKAEFVDRYVNAKTGDLGFRQAAKLFNIKEPVFRSFLISNRVLYMLGGEWTAYAEHVTAGRVTTKVGEAIVSSHAYTQVKFTPRGISWLAGELQKAGMIK